MNLSFGELLHGLELFVLVLGFISVFVRWGRMLERFDQLREDVTRIFRKQDVFDRRTRKAAERLARVEGRLNGLSEAESRQVFESEELEIQKG